VHTLPNRGDSYFPQFFKGKTIRQSYLDYFNAVLESVKADLDYQIIGHIGYVSRYCKGENSKIKYADYSEIFDEILKEIIKRDKCLEINTSSGEAGSDFLPDKDVIERYLALGGKNLSFASDAHKAGDYLRKVGKVEDYLRATGVKKLCYYKAKKCVYYDI
jgi:histidinol-phosphatase (PHP family)